MTPLAVGAAAPDFSLRDQHGQTVTLTSYRGSRAVVLLFYPWAFSRVCGSELRALRDELSTFQSDEVQLLAVSCDPMFSLRAYADAEDLAFPLLSDHWPHGAVARTYGVFNEGTGAADRSTFIIDLGGTVAWSVHNAIPDARDLDEYVAALASLRQP
jgi:mycoredoxin-dependent peroxiredoxin